MPPPTRCASNPSNTSRRSFRDMPSREQDKLYAGKTDMKINRQGYRGRECSIPKPSPSHHPGRLGRIRRRSVRPGRLATPRSNQAPSPRHGGRPERKLRYEDKIRPNSRCGEISEVCNEAAIQPSLFYTWQRELLAGGHAPAIPRIRVDAFFEICLPANRAGQALRGKADMKINRQAIEAASALFRNLPG